MSLYSPFLLVAAPRMQDYRFKRTVVLIIEHNDKGSLGIIINKPLPISLQSIAAKSGLPCDLNSETMAFYGGPVEPQRGTVLVRGDLPMPEDTVIDFVHFISHRKDLLETLMDDATRKFRLYLGYAGWGPGQLAIEITEGTWFLKPLIPDWLLSNTPASLWEAALSEELR
jgi:putative transcriptional regulator